VSAAAQEHAATRPDRYLEQSLAILIRHPAIPQGLN
jgi:hypothetical protein